MKWCFKLHELKSNFQITPLKEIVEITMGQSPKSEYYNTDSEGLPFLQGNKTFGFKYPKYEL